MKTSRLIQFMLSFCCIVVCYTSASQQDISDLSTRGASRNSRRWKTQNVTAINLFLGMNEMNQVVFKKHWKWKSKSTSLIVQENIKQQIMNNLEGSISIEFRLKLNKRSRVSLFRAVSYDGDSNVNTWLDIILNYPSSSIEILLINHHMEQVEYMFNWADSMYKSWISFVLTLSNNQEPSTIALRSGLRQVQTLVVADGIYFSFPPNTVFEIGGKGETATSKFTGIVSKAIVYLAVDSGDRYLDVQPLSVHKKRGASRKPLLAVETTDSSRHYMRTRNVEDDGLLMTLRQEIQQCQNERRHVSSMLTTLKDSQDHLLERVEYLETCECKHTGTCVSDSGNQYNHDESWLMNECTTCTCNAGTVQCQPNITCQDARNPCNSSPCQNNGLCHNNDNEFSCQCRHGYHGELCELIDQCARSVCQNGAACRLLPGNDYECSCLQGYMGKHCESVDWCIQLPCANGGICNNRQGNFECNCQPGYSGDRCQIKDWCYESPCLNNGECANEVEGFRCRCRRGFVGELCQYSDLCETLPCQNSGRCSNTFETNTDGVNRYQCQCPPGYIGNDCERIHYCLSTPCRNGGVCSDHLEGFQCQCRSGYTGERCDNVDRCSTEPCMNGATCINVGRGFECRCTHGFHGSLCERRDFCVTNACLNGGTCVSEGRGFACRCRLTHYGDRCEHADYCRARPCMNEGVCRNTPQNSQQPFTCDCPDGFVGSICETRDVCSSNPCLHDGVCAIAGRRFRCDCVSPYIGERCENLDYCSRNPCLNGGSCLNQERGFVCSCPETHMGQRCENPHPCRDNPCLNGGECSSTDDRGYTCTCPPTHYGTQCNLVNSCYGNICQNGGSCINTNTGFMCMCLDGFYGDDCSFSDACQENPCLNGGVCQNNNGHVICNCPSTHHGSRCELQQNVCLYLSDRGTTCGNRRSGEREKVQRWYYDKFTQSCKSLAYGGCGGNSNNFISRQDCRQRCIIGACCLKSISRQGHKSMMCRIKSLGQCKRINAERNDVQVIGFEPGAKCSASTCQSSDTCMFGGISYDTGDSVRIGCDKSCTCLDDNVLDCPCTEASVRREIRRLTFDDLQDYQQAIRSLKMTNNGNGGNVWDAMRDEYLYRAPIAQSGVHFLMWNRAFLRKMELLLQKVNCEIAIPYYDFTIDAGRFNESVVWQPNYFGGNDECVPDHPFKSVSNGEATDWSPCLVRDFNLSVSIPNMVDIAIAMKSRNVEELGSSLLQLVSYVRAYIGGDMATSACVYDPLFLSIHAYVDNIFFQWQQEHTDVELPSSIQSIPLGMSAELVWSGACASYVGMGHLNPCNRTEASPHRFGSDGYNLQGYNMEGFNRYGYDRNGFDAMGRDRRGQLDPRSMYVYDGYNPQGYNKSGFDRRGFNKYGFCKGYNRDGYDVNGYDQDGYSRYGFDKRGYDKNNFDIYGVSRRGQADESDFYDRDTGYSDCCFSRDGLTVSGIDRYGFTPAGYDIYQCNYFFNGPHTMYYQEKLWNALSVQPRSFLTSLLRTCGSLSGQPRLFLEHNWLKNSYRLSPLRSSDELSSVFSKRFCFDVDMLLSWCPCLDGNYPAICHINPCYNAACELHPTARCHINLCGSCSAEFFLNGRRVNCEDPCSSNPCANGGTCTASRFTSASERFECTCPNGFAGSLCERQVTDTCMLPQLFGACMGRKRRWYYNKISQSCEAFTYSGCGGNLNNFPNREICDLRCSVGACCYRSVGNASQLIGYDVDGYDKYGFNKNGIDRNGRRPTSRNFVPHGGQVLGAKGFGHDGYNIYGYDELGCDRQGYWRSGYHNSTGFNRTGYSSDGEYDQLSEFDSSTGLNREGFDRAGFLCNGLNVEGYNSLGFYKQYTYECQSLSHSDCESMSHTHEVLAFSPGRSCQEVQCGDNCGCNFNGEVRKFGEKFQHGCQECSCSLGGTIECICQRLGKRKEIRDLTKDEKSLYQSAIQKLYESGKWDDFVGQHSEYMPHANGRTTSLPWHRFFITNLERELQKQSGCSIFIPYFDWTIDVGSLNESFVWSAGYFGGNGESETNCVSYHPFDGLDKWHPCIRRQFNTSISLPDAVNFHLLLQEPNFESFSLQLEAMSALFHLWVGGHMASPFSPYDPVYLSHWAFMDYIWSEWQKLNPNGLSRFPTSHRYVQLKPFDVTPDDVLSSQKQTCVNYIRPTLGSPCNSSSSRRSLARNADGFDRNGFDPNGFDIEGFNSNGRDLRGDRDSRKVYDDNDFTMEGYHRSGFDTQGWDAYGFNRMNFNRDGIDIEGYDVSGYDQFGFDRRGKTPFGMYKNGRFAAGADEGHAASLFDLYGFNRFSLNSAGVNHKGYSAYGFNAHGYDQDNCNYYNKGPHYMRFYFFGQMQMKTLQKQSLLQIKRVCRPITPLPLWISQGWLANSDRVKDFERQWAEAHPTNNEWRGRASSATEDGLWAPLTPDKQFCYDLRWFSGCPIGTPLVECTTDYCTMSKCASHPRSQCRTKNCGSCYPEFYDGATGEVHTCYGCIDNSGRAHSEASSWEFNCTSCICQGGMIACTPSMCPATSCSHPARLPDQCCETCDACILDGEIYRNGQQIGNNPCETCQCVMGSVICRSTTANCPRLACTNPVRQPGECCLSCPIGCQGHADGEEWSMEPCHTCRCNNREMHCRQNPCPALRCNHPYKASSSCCPECRDCEVRGRKFSNGESFRRDACTQCTCVFGNINCVTQQCPPLRCVNQRMPPDTCCPICVPGCEYEGQTYRNGEMFHPQRSPCQECVCQDNRVECRRGPGCQALVLCPRPVMREGGCCPHCTECNYGDRTYRNYQVWTSDNGCERCRCENGNVACTDITPCGEKCSHGLEIRGQCCQECFRCSFKSKVYRDSEVFFNENNPCQRCICQRGNVTCDVVSCPTLQCSVQRRNPGECCPSCQVCHHGSVQHEQGSTWRLNEDACTTCTCRDGKISCSTEDCSDVNCDNPITLPNTCCPSCSGCLYQNVQYNEGDVVDTDDSCQSCTCMRGNVICNRKGCVELSCPSQVTLPGQCCPSCSSCTYRQEVYSDGSTFTSPRNPCLQCTCEAGETTCNRIDLDCPELECSHPGREYGSCCAACNNCEYERRNYRNGMTFTPPGTSPCFTCTCLNGSVSCETDVCEGISCPSPVMTPGRCCPVCEVCEVDNVVYSSGDSWSPDMCTTCTCVVGRIECSLNECQETSCSHPAQLPGTCCAKCDMCLMENRVFLNGQTFPHPIRPCQTCRCESGNVVCSSPRCARLSCRNPVTKERSCCPSCPTSCALNDTSLIEEGTRIAHPNDPCRLCLCKGGVLDCDKVCSQPSCSYPTDGECCRDNCDGCFYRGKNYYNGETFSRKGCRKCTCRNGNVRCRQQNCPPLQCSNPHRIKGKCCPVCPTSLRECELNGRSISNDEQIPDGCRICHCRDGTVSCRRKACPPFTCTHPTKRNCCRYCGGCEVEGISYKSGDAVPNGSGNACEMCRCLSGNLICAAESCPDVQCSHPSPGPCCPICEGCLYGETMYSDGDKFASSDNPCNECTCTKGSVVCERKRCDDSTCTHPVISPVSCCPVCGENCLFHDDVYLDGFTFTDAEDQCRSCTCTKGSIVCQAKSCTKVSCRNPTIDVCKCPVCDGCNYFGAPHNNHDTFTNPEDERCSKCYCQNGNVNCGRQNCASSSCTHPTLDVCNCPLCDDCLYHGETYHSGEEFMDVEDTCNNCECEDGNVVCRSRVCTDVDCINPSIDKCGCPVCLNCNYLGVEYENNEHLIDTMNKCNRCVCKRGTVQCSHVPCPSVRCANPATPFGECCPKCIGTCPVEQEVYENGATFVLPSDPCSSCTCTSGEVRCVKQRCDRSCTHPLALSQCCPDCSGCFYQGREYEEGNRFTSLVDPCQQCSCYRGNIRCQDLQCPVPDCANPRVARGKCCPECSEELSNACSEQGRIHEAGSRWLRRTSSSCSECSCDTSGSMICTATVCSTDCTHPVPLMDRCCPVCNSCFYSDRTYSNGEKFRPNNCQECVCNQGNVRCFTETCPSLTCHFEQQVETSEGCCPQCISCSMEGNYYADGETWNSADDICTSCQCQQGVVTCRKVECLPTCQLMNHVPGQCCPVCRGCTYRRETHSIGDKFEPNPMDPCEVCECMATEDGLPSLSCHRVRCPSLADCPRSCVRQPEPGTCCPTCTNRPDCSFGNCNPSIAGHTIHPSDDPCFSCSCNVNNTWVCAHMTCLKLDCPEEARYTPQGSCCPICDTCHLAVENRNVGNGYRWMVNECRTCHCDHGSIVCFDHECEMLNCELPTIRYKQPGQCCGECVDPSAGCLYEGHSIPPRHRWLVDKCTTCHCFAGKVNCVTQRCRMPMCDSDEVATVVPGECCPRCISQPANCIAFGDPHYRTFDGRMIHFQGSCRYLLTSDCLKGHFRIEVENSNRGGSYGAVTWTDKIFVTIATHKISMTSDYTISINGTAIRQLPILVPPHLFIDRSGSHIIVNSHIGVQVLWNAGQRHLEVNVPGTYKRRTCGLCGNFNNYPQDDLRLMNSRMTSSDVVFGNNWKVTGRNVPTCPDAVEHDPCDSLTYAQRKRVNTACKVIRSDVFSACHQVVSPEMYFSACVHDACACGENAQFCLCDALEAYAAQCRRSGVIVRWRSSSLCAIRCARERGYVFDECGSPCKRTCANKNLPPGVVEEQCFMPCVSGCQCAAGKVEHRGRCIAPLLCPDNISSMEAPPVNVDVTHATPSS